EVIVSSSGKYCGPIIKLNLKSSIQVLQATLKKFNLQNLYIINTSEANTEVAAQLRQYFNITGLTPGEARLFTDKSLMKKAVSSQGLNTPNSVPLLTNYTEISSHCGASFIAKPTDAAGSYGVELIQSQNDLNDYHKKYLSTNKNL
ncbi:hypothetical protein ACR9PT_14865, partial [Piscirickettsia salmonis]